MDQRKRRAALHFLRNISLDGRPPQGFQGRLLGAEAGGAVAMSTQHHHSSITTALVHSSGADDQASNDNVPTRQPVGEELSDSEGQAASGISHLHDVRPLSDAVTGRFTPRPQRGLSGALKKQTHTSSDSQSSTFLEHQRTSFVCGVTCKVKTNISFEPFCAVFSISAPRRKSYRRVHFIKSMRQHDTSAGRIILISVRRAICCVFSLIPYRDYGHTGNVTMESGHQHLSGAVATREIVIGLEGVELGDKGKTVSYIQLLYPTYALIRGTHMVQRQRSAELFYPAAPRGFQPVKTVSSHYNGHTGLDHRHCTAYDPNLLEDPHWPRGKHKRVLVFPSYMTSVIEYTKPSELKRDMNETFREKFPHIRLTLSKIRSLKKEIRKLAQEDCGYEVPTVAMALVYFEKLALRGKLDKQNRKLCAGACILLAAKIGSDVKRFEVKQLIDRLEERLRLNRRELLLFELAVLVALEFNLHLPDHELLPHYRHLLQTA
ncbi:hypothetical protein ACEWY4_018969 [Coilia grayii]|uniref:Cyclin N-terminal domain-containing protein n=1 Tax=Coilia grayii TaxID=363190 RepID=A0ABD1JEZ4_9TELE